MNSPNGNQNSPSQKNSEKAGEASKSKKPQGQPQPGAKPDKSDPQAADEEAAEGGAKPESGSPGGKSGSGGNLQKPEGAPGADDESAPDQPAGGDKAAPKKSASKQNASQKQGQQDAPSNPSSGEQQNSPGSDSGSASPGEGEQSQSGAESSMGGGTPNENSRSGVRSGGSNPANAAPGDHPEGVSSPQEEVDMENRKKAASLALRELEKELSRGKQPKELMEELGYSEEDLENFLKQFDQDLNQGVDQQSPEAQARRRQFEELLKGIDVGADGDLRSGGDQPRNASQSSGSNRRPTPRKYEASEEAFRKRIQNAK